MTKTYNGLFAQSAPAGSADTWNRRTMLGAMLSGSVLAGCAGIPAVRETSITTDKLQQEQHLPPEGVTIYSESIQASLADPEGRNFLSMRICQYPDAEVAWVWAAILIDGEFFQVADNSAPWKGSKSVYPDANDAVYSAQSDAGTLQFSRQGKLSTPLSGSATFTSGGDPRVEAVVDFFPTELFAGLIPGRSEIFGHAAAAVRIGGKTVQFAGPGQWHEQQQTDPRFTTPFIYSSLWGEGTFATWLQTPDLSGGYIIRPNGVAAYTDMVFNQPGPNRTAKLTSGTGETAQFELSERHDYTISIYGKNWRGAFVSGLIGDTPVNGFLNSWLYQSLTLAPSDQET